MTKDDIIRMAREADIDWHKHWNDDETNRLEIFAQLVAAAEREACAKVCDEIGDESDSFTRYILRSTAEVIRARGETTSRGQQ